MNLGFFNISQMCAKIDFNRQPTQPTVIDLRDVSFIEPFAVIYLGMLLRHFNSNGVRFEITLPRDPRVKSYLARQRLFQRFNFDANTVRYEQLIRIETTTSLNDIVDITHDAP